MNYLYNQNVSQQENTTLLQSDEYIQPQQEDEFDYDFSVLFQKQRPQKQQNFIKKPQKSQNKQNIQQQQQIQQPQKTQITVKQTYDQFNDKQTNVIITKKIQDKPVQNNYKSLLYQSIYQKPKRVEVPDYYHRCFTPSKQNHFIVKQKSEKKQEPKQLDVTQGIKNNIYKDGITVIRPKSLQYKRRQSQSYQSQQKQTFELNKQKINQPQIQVQNDIIVEPYTSIIYSDINDSINPLQTEISKLNQSVTKTQEFINCYIKTDEDQKWQQYYEKQMQQVRKRQQLIKNKQEKQEKELKQREENQRQITQEIIHNKKQTYQRRFTYPTNIKQQNQSQLNKSKIQPQKSVLRFHGQLFQNQ